MNAQQSQPLNWPLPVTPIDARPSKTFLGCVAAHAPGSTSSAGSERQSSERVTPPTDIDGDFGVENPICNSGSEILVSQQKQLHPGHSISVDLSVPQQPSDQLQGDTHAGHGETVTTGDILQAKERYDIVNMLSFPDLQNIAEAAHILFTIGSSQAAHDLYFMLWQALLARRHVPIPLLVSAAIDVARSSLRPAQLNAAQLVIDNLLGDSKDNLMSPPGLESTLRAQLSDVLRKSDQPSQPLGECNCALHDISSWSHEIGNVRHETKALGSLSYQCKTGILDCLTESFADTSLVADSCTYLRRWAT